MITISKWINVKDSFPAESGEYLCLYENGEYVIANFNKDIEEEGNAFPFGYECNPDNECIPDWSELNNIQWWQELPKRPNEITENKLCHCWEPGHWYLKDLGTCNGTREREPCTCEGDTNKCNFYPEKRHKGD